MPPEVDVGPGLGRWVDCPRPVVDDEVLLGVLAAAVSALNLLDLVISSAVAAAERAGVPGRRHLRTGADLLRLLGMAPGAAARAVRVGRAASSLPALTVAQRLGGIGIEFADAVGRGVAHVESRAPLSDDDRAAVVRALMVQTSPAEVAAKARAIAIDRGASCPLQERVVPVAEAAVRALYLINQDGLGPDIARHQRGINVGKQDADGLTRITGWVDAELAAYLGTVNDTWARPGFNNPEDPDSPTNPETETPDGPGPGSESAAAADGVAPDPTQPQDPSALWEQLPLPTTLDELADRITAVESAAAAAATPAAALPPLTGPALRDTRSLAQRQHDALKAVLRDTLASGRLGQHNGLPVTVVVSTTLAELEAAAGIAITGTGTLMPMPDLIRLAEHAHHYLVVYRHHTAEPLYLGRTKRLATKAQRLLLYNRDRGCTRPGCTRCANRCQAHHADPSWARGGHTDAPTLGLGCPPDNRLAELGWTTKIDPTTGRVHWHPPPLLDTGGDTINHHFHPEELLNHPEEAVDDPERQDDSG
ncbi:HNH endonuclease signature motif containing protein [Mycolicibacterium neoaurum]|uniref:HNH endonuclease signature motif containing protein n=1 Tax=Mycolicibacterium neoaurum TaxID=1795 RepID=UPI00248C8037|nr:HNH endonuclease signature motif containing protein [Mycolicibacterium neoaurum]WBP93769.1 DUF222 domain-containing protein [Mycolicibacterium neoaurum]